MHLIYITDLVLLLMLYLHWTGKCRFSRSDWICIICMLFENSAANHQTQLWLSILGGN